jgi:hypothetical protein
LPLTIAAISFADLTTTCASTPSFPCTAVRIDFAISRFGAGAAVKTALPLLSSVLTSE